MLQHARNELQQNINCFMLCVVCSAQLSLLTAADAMQQITHSSVLYDIASWVFISAG